MNQKIKYVGILVTILPLFLVALSSDYIQDAEAKKAEEELGSLSGITKIKLSGEVPIIPPIIGIIGVGI